MHLAQGGVEQEAQESSTKKTICCHAESLLASFAPKNAELCRRPRAAERGPGALRCWVAARCWYQLRYQPLFLLACISS